MRAANSNDRAVLRSGSAATKKKALPPFWLRHTTESEGATTTNRTAKITGKRNAKQAQTSQSTAAAAAATAKGALSKPAVCKLAAQSPSAAKAAVVAKTSARSPAAAKFAATAATAQSSSSILPSLSSSHLHTNKMAVRPKRKVYKCVCSKTAAAPLELLVVGHQINMQPWHNNTAPMPSPPPIARWLPTTPSRIKPKNINLNLLSQWRPGYVPQNHVNDNYNLLENGEFVYIYETNPSELVAASKCHLSASKEVMDSRFLAELIDEFLITES